VLIALDNLAELIEIGGPHRTQERLEQLRRLRDFKRATYKRALVRSFADSAELHSTLRIDLTRQVRDLKATVARLLGPRLRVGVTERDLDGELHDTATVKATPHPTAGHALEVRIITENFGEKSARNLKWTGAVIRRWLTGICRSRPGLMPSANTSQMGATILNLASISSTQTDARYRALGRTLSS